ncbi:hypothetical protein BH18ACT15_BH18ACT15_13590 [soil metagenome]
MDSKTLVKRNPRVVYRDLAEDAGGILLHLDTSNYHNINPTCVVVWETIGEDGASFGQLLAELKKRLHNFPENGEGDITAFVTGLSERELLLLEEGTSAHG